MDATNNQNSASVSTPTPAPVVPPIQQALQPDQISQLDQALQPLQDLQSEVQTAIQPQASRVQSQAPVAQPSVAQAPGQVVNPVIMPNTSHGAIGQDFIMPSAQGVDMSSLAGSGFVNATDPITMPTPPKAPDPIEEELKAPLKAAEPVPGSIGSAISVPAAEGVQDFGDADEFKNGGKTPSVSFTDPALANAAAKPMKVKKKTDKKTLIALVIVAVMVVIALATVLILQLNGILTF